MFQCLGRQQLLSHLQCWYLLRILQCWVTLRGCNRAMIVDQHAKYTVWCLFGLACARAVVTVHKCFTACKAIVWLHIRSAVVFEPLSV